ncbi:restriction endonuclease subunit S [Acinetobacter sp. P1(2025)]|uniref:restriction endonuclease subunit S n=1 Tax=Acinetobacter sp. P1(2025) TaxID=3446120 RepID=UPI003F52EBCD
MQFKQYPSYKDSGVEWLGEVPEHWRISSLKRYGYFKGGAGFPHAYQGNTEENIPFFKVNSLSKDKRFLSSFSDFVGEETAKKLGAKIFPKNSIFFAKVGAALLLERIRTNQQPCCIDNNMMGFVIQNELSFDFAFYLMSLIDFKYLVNPGAVPSINESQISSFLISVPPISEQTQISNFLEQETTRIDNLIAKQEKLIELLEEQRKSIISHAVTKGLNPNAPMKDSGVEWLGDVPEHWNLKRFGYLFDENKKKNIGLKETNVLSLSYGNIKEKNIDDNKGLLPESFETYQIIEPNNIVFRFTDLQNDKRSLRSAISKYHGIITSAYIAVKTKQNADFYNYLFRAYDLQKVFYSMGEGMRQSLKMDELNKMPVVLPNKDEQTQIVSFLDTETARIDNLIAKQEKLIELLEEQRKSIISHAVTGKIDVREFVA